MRREFLVAIRMAAATLVLTGIIYPLTMTGLAHVLFPQQANGTLVVVNGRAVGSELIGQAFSSPAYFHGRPSAAGSGYDALASGDSNLGPTSKALHTRVTADVDTLRAQNPRAPGPVPVDLVTASGSGLDPQISLDAALWQAPRVATVRAIQLAQVQMLVRAHLERRSLGILGEPRINVLLLNLALDRQVGVTGGSR